MGGGQTGEAMRGSTNLGVIVTASLAGLLFGFDTVVISGVTESVGKVFHLAAGSFWYGFSVASALLGTFIGALVAANGPAQCATIEMPSRARRVAATSDNENTSDASPSFAASSATSSLRPARIGASPCCFASSAMSRPVYPVAP